MRASFEQEKLNLQPRYKIHELIKGVDEKGCFAYRKCQRTIISILILQWTGLFSYLFLILRLSQINKIPETVALLLSIVATFITSTESQISDKIKDPCTYA